MLMAPEEGNSYALKIENAANQAERFVWTKANFGQDVAVNYEIQLDKFGNESMPNEIYNKLTNDIGKYVSIFPKTQIRAGGTRPYLVVA